MLAAVACCVCLTGTGCGPSLPETIPVSGTVTFEGRPMPLKGIGRVSFVPVEPAEGCPNRPASAMIKEDGSFTMTSFAPGDGVVPGKYQIAIFTKTSGPFVVPEVWAAPKRYASARKSGLKMTVESGSEPMEEVRFDLVR